MHFIILPSGLTINLPHLECVVTETHGRGIAVLSSAEKIVLAAEDYAALMQYVKLIAVDLSLPGAVEALADTKAGHHAAD